MKFRPYSIRGKLFLLGGILIVLLLVVFMLVFDLALFQTVQENRRRTKQLAQNTLDSISRNMKVLETASAFPILRTSSLLPQTIYHDLFTWRDADSYPYSVIRDFDTTLDKMIRLHDGLSVALLTNRKGYGYIKDTNTPWGSSLQVHVDPQMSWFLTAMEGKGKATYFSGTVDSLFPVKDSQSYLFCARAVVNAEHMQSSGMTLAGIPMQLLFASFFDNRVLSGQECTVTRKGSLLAVTREGLREENVFSGRVRHDGRTYETVSVGDDDLGIIILTDRSSLFGSIRTTTIVMLLLITCVVAIMLVFSTRMVKSIFRPVGQLMVTIDEYGKGNFLAKADIGGNNEFALIGKRLAEMADHIETLIVEGHKKDLEKKEYELQVLKNQINSHFLYNSLDSARMNAYLNNDNQVADMLALLSSILRYGLATSNALVPLADEITNVKEFVAIQNMRGGGHINLQISLEEACKMVKLPRITLQPIVENSVKHAFSSTQETCCISILGYLEDEVCVLNLSDDGEGVDAMALEVLDAKLADSHVMIGSNGSNIGLANVNRRIQLFFGPEFGIHASSCLGKGFSVTLRVPLERTI